LNELQAKIGQVTVFRDGARVTRTGKIKLAPGPQKVLVPGITDYAQADSFRVKGRGPAALTAFDVRRKTEVFQPHEKMKSLYEELEGLKLKQQAVADEIEINTTHLQQTNEIMTRFSEIFGMLYAAGESKITMLDEIDKGTTKVITDTKTTLRALEEQAKEIADQIRIVEQNMGVLQSRRQVDANYEVEVSLEVSKEAEVELDITYQTSGANWASAYDVDLYPGKAHLRRIAMVSNTTKEPWEKVRLVISTAMARPVEAVEGTPLYITAYDPTLIARGERSRKEAPKMMMKTESMSMAKPPGGMPAPSPPPAPMEVVFAEASESTSGITVYELPKPASIPFDNERHPVTLTEESLESKTIHYWYADQMAEVVAQDSVTNGENVILPGKVKVYAEGDYIGETGIQQVSPREEFKLGTRFAYNVKAKKQLVEREVERAGITRGKLRRYYKYRLEIESFAKEEIGIEVVDRIPHSLNPAIEVKIEATKLGLEKHELGIMEWKKKIQPNEKATITYDYEVYWEKDISISPGLP
jgi:uncharacterized protein (TIGR02231 family)